MELKYEKQGCSVRPLTFNSDKCLGCNRCVNICQCDVLLPGKPPIVAFPGECYYCGSCVMECPVEGKAIHLEHPLMNRAKFVAVKGE